MSRTIRKVPPSPNWTEEFKDTLKRGLVSIPKSDECGDDVWGQKGKKSRKKMLSRKARRNLKLY